MLHFPAVTKNTESNTGQYPLRYARGVVYSPGEVDLHGDTMSED